MNATSDTESTSNNTPVDTETVAATTPLPPRKLPKPVTINRCINHGRVKWKVRYFELGKWRKAFRDSQVTAEAFASEKRCDLLTAAQQFALLPKDEQRTLMLFKDEAARRNVPLVRLFGLFQREQIEDKVVPGAKAVLDAYIKELKEHGKVKLYVDGVRQIVSKFIAGREELPANLFNVEDCRAFVGKYKLRSRPSVRSRISGFISYTIQCTYRKDNPCALLGRIELDTPPPQIFSIAEMETCWKWLGKNPKAMGWFILTCLAGLRPESEAMWIRWEDIFEESRTIDVTKSKTEPRLVKPMPQVFDWLKVAKDLGAELPMSKSTLKRERNALREALWGKQSKWKQDVTRHTAVSYWLGEIKSFAELAIQVGNSERILKKHYRRPVLDKLVKEFWAMTPDKFGFMPPVAAIAPENVIELPAQAVA